MRSGRTVVMAVRMARGSFNSPYTRVSLSDSLCSVNISNVVTRPSRGLAFNLPWAARSARPRPERSRGVVHLAAPAADAVKRHLGMVSQDVLGQVAAGYAGDACNEDSHRHLNAPLARACSYH